MYTKIHVDNVETICNANCRNCNSRSVVMSFGLKVPVPDMYQKYICLLFKSYLFFSDECGLFYI